MKHVITDLTEQQFLNRLNSMCTKQDRLDNGQTLQNTFVVKKKRQSFRIGRHLTELPFMRSGGYYSDFLYGNYTVNSLGKVELTYRFGRPFIFIIPFLTICLIALPIFIYLLYDAVFNAYYQWGGLLVSMIFSFIGLFYLFAYSKKDRSILENHLHKICFPNNQS